MIGSNSGFTTSPISSINDKLKSASITSDKDRVELVEVLNIDISRLNNYPVDEVITIIDREPLR